MLSRFDTIPERDAYRRNCYINIARERTYARCKQSQLRFGIASSKRN